MIELIECSYHGGHHGKDDGYHKHKVSKNFSWSSSLTLSLSNKEFFFVS